MPSATFVPVLTAKGDAVGKPQSYPVLDAFPSLPWQGMLHGVPYRAYDEWIPWWVVSEDVWANLRSSSDTFLLLLRVAARLTRGSSVGS